MPRPAESIHDADREGVERLVGELRRDPGSFSDAAALAAGIGPAMLEEQVGRHFHASLGDLLERARVTAAQARLSGDEPLGEVAEAVGFESPADLTRRFRRATRCAPERYRRWIRGGGELPLDLPASFRSEQVLRYLARDPASLGERRDGERMAHAVRLSGEGPAGTPALLILTLAAGRAVLRIESAVALGDAQRTSAHELALRLLGLGDDPTSFEERVLAEPTLAPLVAPRRGLTVPQTRDVFDGLVWVVSGQQVSLPVAYGMRRRLVAEHGTPVGDLVAPPTAEEVARLDEAELRRLGFSRSKASYLTAAARQVATGELDLEGLSRGSATVAEERLLAVRGLGPWSVHYLLMRSMGFADCLPRGDVGLERSLQGFFGLAERPRGEQVVELMRRFAPHRSLATFHFWSRLEDGL